MKLIVGLGNIGQEYENTRHNVGFYILDLFAKEHNLTFNVNLKLKVLSCKIGDTFLIKPTTFMNLSGLSVRATIDFYKIYAKDVLVIHDDIDQLIGNYKIVETGGSGGHRGVTSIFDHLGIKDTNLNRVKIGVAPKIYNPSIHKAEDFVLQKLNKDEIKAIDQIYKEDIGSLIG